MTEILDAAFPWSVDFVFTVAKRARLLFLPQPTGNPHSVLRPYEVTYERFRFDQPGFDLDAYDQVWLFGYQPGNDGGPDSNIGWPRTRR